METEVKIPTARGRHIHDVKEDDPYQRLKGNLCEALTDEQLERLKQYFTPDIDSRRSLSRIQSGCDLLNLLEIRDCLSKDDITCLNKSTSVISNSKIEELLHTYKKLYGSDQKPCSLCKVHLPLTQPFPSRPNTVAEHSEYTTNYNNDAQVVHPNHMPIYEESSELDAAIERLSINVGENWSVLVRELGLIEKIIADIREDSKDVREQAVQALRIWKSEAGRNATLAALEVALNNRICKQKGLGPHLIHQNRILCS